jgi:hypothetical protein
LSDRIYLSRIPRLFFLDQIFAQETLLCVVRCVLVGVE